MRLKNSQIRLIENVMKYPQGLGYVLDFSDRKIAEFFDEEFGIDFDQQKYSVNGTSKRHRLTTLLLQEEPFVVVKILRALWDRRVDLKSRHNVSREEGDEYAAPFLELLASIESGSNVPKSAGIDRYTAERTLDELVSDIDRCLRANKPETAIDRLHTYCAKKIAHLLEVRGIEYDDDEPLHSRFGKYRKALVAERSLSDFTDRAMKAAISQLEAFNDIRNNRSLAHDNLILDSAEARYVFDTVNALLVFIRSVEAEQFEAQTLSNAGRGV